VSERRPNILWVFGDQHRGQALGCAGDPNLATPEIDRMAVEGLHFHRAVSGCPWCTPFRGTLMTGRYPHRCVYRTPMAMDRSQRTIAHHLGDAGYRTHYVGKWHLDGSNGPGRTHVVPPEGRGGFLSWIGYENNNAQYDCHVHGHDERGDEIGMYRLPGYETDDLTDLMIARLRDEAARRGRGEEEPFFAVLSVQPPHGPYVAPPEDMARHRPGDVRFRPNVPPIARIREAKARDLAGYYAQIENLDRNLGRIRCVPIETGLEDETWVFFFSDHGDMQGSHGYNEKSCPWEESIRIPFLVQPPPGGGTRRGRVDAVLNTPDILPTTLGVAGVAAGAELPGFDHSPLFDAKGTEPFPGQPESAYLQHCVRKRHRHSIDRTWRGVVTRDHWKYVCLEGQPLIMHDLDEDPYELDNRAFDQAYLPQRERLQALLADWIERTGDEFPLPEL